jgi:hypothetical protein
MNKLLNIFGFVVLLAAVFASCAAAATLLVGSASLAAGSVTVNSCGVSSLSATRNVDNSGNVTLVSVSGIPTACSGETLSVTLAGARNVSLGGGSATRRDKLGAAHPA